MIVTGIKNSIKKNAPTFYFIPKKIRSAEINSITVPIIRISGTQDIKLENNFDKIDEKLTYDCQSQNKLIRAVSVLCHSNILFIADKIKIALRNNLPIKSKNFFNPFIMILLHLYQYNFPIPYSINLDIIFFKIILN